MSKLVYYAELAKRLRKPIEREVRGILRCRPLDHVQQERLEAADAIEALTSPPDEAQVDAASRAYRAALAGQKHDERGVAIPAALNAAYRIRVKKKAT